MANVTLQDQGPAHPVEHLGLAIDDLAYRWTRRALRRKGPADPDRPIA